MPTLHADTPTYPLSMQWIKSSPLAQSRSFLFVVRLLISFCSVLVPLRAGELIKEPPYSYRYAYEVPANSDKERPTPLRCCVYHTDPAQDTVYIKRITEGEGSGLPLEQETKQELFMLKAFTPEDATTYESCLGDSPQAREGLGVGMLSCTPGNFGIWLRREGKAPLLLGEVGFNMLYAFPKAAYSEVCPKGGELVFLSEQLLYWTADEGYTQQGCGQAHIAALIDMALPLFVYHAILTGKKLVQGLNRKALPAGACREAAVMIYINKENTPSQGVAERLRFLRFLNYERKDWYYYQRRFTLDALEKNKLGGAAKPTANDAVETTPPTEEGEKASWKRYAFFFAVVLALGVVLDYGHAKLQRSTRPKLTRKKAARRLYCS